MKNLFNAPKKATPWLIAAGSAAVLGTAAWLASRYLNSKKQVAPAKPSGRAAQRNRNPQTIAARHSNL